MITNPTCATNTPRRAQLRLSANVHSVPPNSRLRTCQPRVLKKSSTRARTERSSPVTVTPADSGSASIFTGRSGGSRFGMTRQNVAKVMHARIKPMMARYAAE